jgi:tRNA G10  N-methylase Trm11
MWLCQLGRQADLSIAELEARFGADNLQVVREDFVIVEAESVAIEQFGGVRKVGRMVADGAAPSTSPKNIVRLLSQATEPHPGKMNIGISWYGQKPPRQVQAIALELKKALRATGQSVRVVPNKTATISTAQSLYNQLNRSAHYEWMIVPTSDQLLVARMIGVQDIDAYRQRDFERPARDATVGMLPPKLAQILINLAAGQLESQHQQRLRILDPFCGTGVVLQEALLMGYAAYGSDLEARMVDMAERNLQWLRNRTSVPTSDFTVEVGDATNHTWKLPISAVVAEGYLGPPLSQPPTASELESLQTESNELYRKVLTNLHRQLRPGTPVVIAVPAWRQTKRFSPSTLVDQIEQLGYNRVRFTHTPSDRLLYARSNQVVARDILVMIRK